MNNLSPLLLDALSSAISPAKAKIKGYRAITIPYSSTEWSMLECELKQQLKGNRDCVLVQCKEGHELWLRSSFVK